MDQDPNLSAFELVVLSLTVFIVFSLTMQWCMDINPEMERLLVWFDYLCSAVFLLEWAVRYRQAENKKKFVLYNFVDLLASFPIMCLSGFKTLRFIRVFQLIKLTGSVNRFVTYCRCNMIKTAKLALFILFVILMLVSPVMILFFEYETGSINTAENALWWTYCTITTIGYGDLYPVTTGGRIFTVFVSLGGIGMFGIVSTLLINYVIYINKQEEKEAQKNKTEKEEIS